MVCKSTTLPFPLTWQTRRNAIMAFVTYLIANVETTFEAGVGYVYICILLNYKILGDGLSLAG